MKYFYDTEFLEDGKTIELISIGIVAQDGREYYAVNRDANWEAIENDAWLMTNVVAQLPIFNVQTWKFKERIRDEVPAFLTADHTPPELWAWYSAYDHVALAQLFGRMINLPTGIPMFTNDVRSLSTWTGIDRLPKQPIGLHDALADARHARAMYDHIMRESTR
ncbi:3'-5' exoribonuclease domain-containing protein [Glutamicibacter sp.]|uniref:3'-5' exoribonuclease domain-containing protein n=1 Tax=Glutamicibacter sp. TaxID=1931995 RepID=UPI0028BEA796|nr:3'-5' exoribonuclease [Glutamicibacter sp.]